MWNKFDPRPATPHDNHWVVHEFREAGKNTEFKTCLGNVFRDEYLEEVLAEFERRGCTWERYDWSCYRVTCPCPARDLITPKERRNERRGYVGGCLFFLGWKIGFPLALSAVAVALGVSIGSVFLTFFGVAIIAAAITTEKAKKDLVGRWIGGALGVGMLCLAWMAR